MTPEQRREVEVLADGLCGTEDRRAREALWAVLAQVDALTRDRDALRGQKDGAYAERNQCVALIARMALALKWRVSVGRHPDLDTDWEDDWRTLLFVDLPTGQATWHFHDSERHLLRGLPEAQQKWDGHSTEEKYRRVRAAPSPSPAVPVEVAKEEAKTKAAGEGGAHE